MSQFPQPGDLFPLNADSTPTRDQIPRLHVKFVRSGEKGSTKFFLNDADLTQVVSAFAIDVSAKDRNARLILETPTGGGLHLEITDDVPADLILVPKDPKGFLPVQAVNNLIDVLLTHPDPEARQIAKDAAERINAQLRQDVPQPENPALQAVDAPKINGVIPLHAPPAGSVDDSWVPDADGPIGDLSPPMSMTEDIVDSLINSLLLVAHAVPRDVVESWSNEQKETAFEWSYAVHSQASDNDEVVVPTKPDFLNDWELGWQNLYVAGPYKDYDYTEVLDVKTHERLKKRASNGEQGQTSEQLIDEQLERESAAEGPGDAASES